MHQDLTPLCAADIQDQLKKRFAYLSGECQGCGRQGRAARQLQASAGLSETEAALLVGSRDSLCRPA